MGSISTNVNLNNLLNNSEKENKLKHGNIMSLALNQEKIELDKKMSPDSTRKLQDEINVLTKRNCELESQLRSLEAGHSKDIKLDSIDGGETPKFRELENIVRILKQEKDEALKDKQDLYEKIKLQDKELKDALAQRKLAMAEYSEVSDRLSELRQHKQKLSRQVCGNFNKVMIQILMKTHFRLETKKKNLKL